MKLLNRYIILQVLSPSLLALAVISFITVFNELRERIDPAGAEIVRTAMLQVRPIDFAHLAILFLPTVVIYIIPITYMMGILLGFGRLAEHNEITAMRASGVPLKRIVMPVLVGGAVLSAGAFLLQDRVQPAAVNRASQLMFVDIPLRITLDKLPAGVMHDIGDWRFYIGHKDPEAQALYDINILAPERDGGATVYYARMARVLPEAPRTAIELRDGHIIFPEEGGRLARSTFQRWVLTLPELIPREAREDRRGLNLAELRAAEQQLAEEYEATGATRAAEELRRYRREISERVALPFASLAVSLCAAPLAVRRGAGGRTYSFAIGAGVFLGYYLVMMVAERGGLQPLGETVLRAFAPNLVLGLAGAWLIWRVDRV